MNRLKVFARKSKRFFKFGLVGLIGIVVNMGLYWLQTRLLAVPYYIASAVAIEISILNNYIWNSTWTWSDRRSPTWQQWLKRLAQFVFVSNLTAFGVQYVTFLVCTTLLGIHDLLSQMIGIGVGVLFNFGVNHFFVFREQTAEVDEMPPP